MRRILRSIIVFIVLTTIVSFITYKLNINEKLTSMITESNTSIGMIYVEKPKVKIINEESKSRPIAVSINNNHAAWPHAGLQDAYLGYELIAEGGITRLIALFKDQSTAKIGSVRSARHYFLDYVMENDAIFVHYGQSPQAKSDLASLNINNINGMYDAKAFFRDKTLKRAWEHTAFTSMDRINSSIKTNKYRTTTDTQLLKYSPIKVNHSEDETVKTANKVTIKYSDYQTTSYEYDKENMNYKMFMSSKPHTDLVTNKQYTVKNIITYQVTNKSLGDKKGRQDLDNIGTGEGYYISNGEAIKIKWTKTSRSEKTKYTLMNGEELVVNDGNTWIHIQPTGQTLKIE